MNKECPVCYNEDEKLVKFNECLHKICVVCCQHLYNKNMTQCPLCRGIIQLEILSFKNGEKTITDNYYITERESNVEKISEHINSDTESDED